MFKLKKLINNRFGHHSIDRVNKFIQLENINTLLKINIALNIASLAYIIYKV